MSENNNVDGPVDSTPETPDAFEHEAVTETTIHEPNPPATPAAPVAPGPSWRSKVTPVAAGVAAAALVVGGVSGFAIGQATADEGTSQTGRPGQFPGGEGQFPGGEGQFPGGPGGQQGGGQQGRGPRQGQQSQMQPPAQSGSGQSGADQSGTTSGSTT